MELSFSRAWCVVALIRATMPLMPRAHGWKNTYSQWKRENPYISPEARAKLVRGCVCKQGFTSRSDAWTAAATLKPRPGKLLNVYRCPICKLLHIGNRNPTTKADYELLKRLLPASEVVAVPCRDRCNEGKAMIQARSQMREDGPQSA